MGRERFGFQGRGVGIERTGWITLKNSGTEGRKTCLWWTENSDTFALNFW